MDLLHTDVGFQNQIDRTLVDEDEDYEMERRIKIERLIAQKKKQQQKLLKQKLIMKEKYKMQIIKIM